MLDNDRLDLEHKLFAQRRLTGRSLRFARRFAKKKYLFKFFVLYLRGLFKISSNINKTCASANKIYEDFLI